MAENQERNWDRSLESIQTKRRGKSRDRKQWRVRHTEHIAKQLA